jgi:hypothetical protein
MFVHITQTVRCRSSAAVPLLMAASFVLTAALLAGCGVVSTVQSVAKNVEANKNTIDAFTAAMKSGGAKAFAATYVTTGASPATIVYAARPPNQLLFKATPSAGSTGQGEIFLIVNASGEFTCSSAAVSGSGLKRVPTCQKLASAQAAVQNQILNLYTPSHWVAFLEGLSLAAGFAGDKVTQSHLTVNGFAMQCVDFQAPGITGTSTICTTAQGVLGYVKVASETTSFEIKSYSTSPAPSRFKLPTGAKVTTP